MKHRGTLEGYARQVGLRISTASALLATVATLATACATSADGADPSDSATGTGSTNGAAAETHRSTTTGNGDAVDDAAATWADGSSGTTSEGTDTWTRSTTEGTGGEIEFDCPPDTPLAALAGQMEPGTWALLGDGLGELLGAPIFEHPDGTVGGLDIMTWSDDGQWDPKTGQFFFMGLRKTRRFVAYSAQDALWRGILLPRDNELPVEGREHTSPPFYTKWGHIYSRNALDPAGGNFYHMADAIYRFDTAIETWSRLPEGGSYSSTGVIEWFSAADALVNYTPSGGLRLFSEADQTWQELGPTAVHGHHSLGRDNPFRGELLLVGGNESPNTVVRVNSDGTVEQLPDSPITLTIRHGMLTVDPISGRYLILDLGEKLFYDFDSETGVYTLLDDFSVTPWPFENYDAPVVAPIPECGVTMWAARTVVLYKHT